MPKKLSPPIRALVLDGQECHALAAVRSLGRHGVEISAASHKPRAMSFRSRHCAHRLISPAPAEEPTAYADWLLDTLSRQPQNALLFFGEASADVVSRHRDTLQRLTGCPMPPRDTFLTADRKDRVVRLARDLGVPVPASHELRDWSDADALASRLAFPVIVKGVYGSGGHQVELVREPRDLPAAVRRIAATRPDPSLPLPVVQEFIPGCGYGLTALVRGGEPMAVFMHRRLAEHDVQRGEGLAHATAAAESVFEPELQASGLQLLRALRWDGMAMVEFRRSTRDGRFYLMEINPRFAGSLDLAIAAGVDFPWLYVQMTGGPLAPAPAYTLGLKYRWLISKNLANAFEHPLGYALGMLSTLRPDTRSDLCLRDPGPHLSHLHEAAWWVREHVRRRAVAPPPEPEPPASSRLPSGLDAGSPAELTPSR